MTVNTSSSLGVPTWAKIHDSEDVAIVQNSSNRYFWGDDYSNSDGGKVMVKIDQTFINRLILQNFNDITSGPAAETMVYWGIQDQTNAWWSMDLVTEQARLFALDTSDNGVEDSEAVFQ